MFYLRLGERVHCLLKKYNKSQKELADFLNTKTSTINGWKQPNRNPSSDMIIPICRFFNISTDYFLNNCDYEIKEDNTNLNKNMFASNYNMTTSKNNKSVNSLVGPNQYERSKPDLSDSEIELLNLFNKLPDDRSKLKFLGKVEMIINEMIEK